MSRRASWPYRIAAAALLMAVFVVDALAKLGPLGDWSALFDVAMSLLLVAGAVVCIVIGQRRDLARQQSDPDNDY